MGIARAKPQYTLTGRVYDAVTKKPLALASVYILELQRGTVSDSHGRFALARLPEGKYELRARYIGYTTQRLAIQLGSKDTTRAEVFLHPKSLRVGEVNVLGKRRDRSSSTQRIGQEAMDYIQPTSLSDVLQLLPGALLQDANLSKVGQISSRQVGGDANTALGTQLLTDGIPLSNNANLNRVEADRRVEGQYGKGTANRGLDLRAISPDHLQYVDVVQGIASPRYGDLSAGAVIMRSKHGKTPYEIRVKRDPRNLLAYVGKGFGLPKGALHVGVDYTRGSPDVRNVHDIYSRYTAQATWTHRSTIGEMPLSTELRGLYIGTIDSERNDPDLDLPSDSYNARYTKYLLSGQAKLRALASWIDKVECRGAIDYTVDRLERELTVSLANGITPLPLATTEGEAKGLYLPAEYPTSYTMVGKPMMLFGELSGASSWQLLRGIHNLDYGASARVEKNYGAGYSYNIARPPFPRSTTSSRPRAYSDIPAQVLYAGWIKWRILYRGGYGQVELMPGIRLSGMGNMPSAYKALQRPYLEPRLNASYRCPRWALKGEKVDLSIRGGYGQQMKFPTLDMLFPERTFYDLFSLNYVSPQGEEYSLLWVTTRIFDRENYQLEPNRMDKYELGLDLKYAGWELHLTGFREQSDLGYAAHSHYSPMQYWLYTPTKPLPAGVIPKIEDFTDPKPVSKLGVYRTQQNSEKIVKWGVQYKLSLPKIRVLSTKLTLTGAWFKTQYDISQPIEYHPPVYLSGREYPYVGIYGWNRGHFRERLMNTLWVNTHIPRYGLLFSTLVQTVWYSDRWARPYNGFPTAYVGEDGEAHPFSPADAEDPTLRFLVQTHPNHYFDRDRVPLALTVNLKATKEIGRHVRLSFFVNRLFAYLPRYTGRFNALVQRHTSPFFGAEIRVKL